MDSNVFKQQYEDMLRSFLHEISFQILPSTYDPAIEEAVVKHLQSQGFTVDFIQRATPAIQCGAWIASSTYPFTPLKVRETIATYTAIMVLIEDSSKEILADLKALQPRLLLRQSQPNQLLEAAVQFMNTIRESYGPFISDIITKSTLDFFTVCVLEQEYDGSLNLTPSAPDFPDYIRLKSGIGEAYACFAFPQALFPEETFLRTFLPAVPELIRYINLCNDFLSFYKECVVSNERMNYIYNHSRTIRVTPIQSLQEVRSATIACVRNSRETLAVNLQMQSNIEQLFHGFVMFHFGATRYKLSDLGIQEIENVRERVRFPSHGERQDQNYGASCADKSVKTNPFSDKSPC